MAKRISKKEKIDFDNKKTKFSFNNEDFEMADRQKLFCMEYVRRKLDGKEAAIAAGYSKPTAISQASRLLANADVQRYIAALKKDIATVIGISAVDIAKEYARIGFSDIRKIFDANGALINIRDIEADPAANISSVEVFEEFEGKGAERTSIGQTKKVKFYDKVAALDKLAKMIGVDGVTKIAQTDSSGNDIVMLPKKELHEGD